MLNNQWTKKARYKDIRTWQATKDSRIKDIENNKKHNKEMYDRRLKSLARQLINTEEKHKAHINIRHKTLIF
jgi:hypothetical protein